MAHLMSGLSDKHANNCLHRNLHNIIGSRKSTFPTRGNSDFQGILKLRTQNANLLICNNNHHHSNNNNYYYFGMTL